MAEDDQADPKVGPTVAQKFVDAKVAGVVGHLNSGVTIPASAIYNQAGIPMISGSATNPEADRAGLQDVFRTVGRDDQQGPAVASYLASELKPRRSRSSTTPPPTARAWPTKSRRRSRPPASRSSPREKTNDKTTDCKAILTKIKGKNARRRVLRRHGRHRRPDDQAGARTRHQGGVRVRRRRLHRRDDEARRRRGRRPALLAGRPPGRRRRSRSSSTPTRPSTATIKQYAPFTYDAANLLIAAMQKADSADPAKYLPELAKISYDGATGKIEFDDKGDRKDAEMTIFTMKGGKIEPIAIIKGGKTHRSTIHEGGSARGSRRRPRPRPAAPAPAPATPAAPAARAEEVTARVPRSNGALRGAVFWPPLARGRGAGRIAAERLRRTIAGAGLPSARRRPPPLRRRSDADRDPRGHLPAAAHQRPDAGQRLRRRRAGLHDGLRHHPADQLRPRRGGDDRRDGRVLRHHRARRRAPGCRRC